MTDHLCSQELLPWYANGTLNEEEMALCTAHIAQCDECREDLAAMIEQMRNLNRHTPSVLDEVTQSPDALLLTLQTPPQRVRRWPAALAATLVVVSALIVSLKIPEPPGYRLLTSTTDEPGYHVQVAFQPGTPEVEIRRFILDSGGTVVGNPTAAGIYRLKFTEPLAPSALDEIKNAAAIVWASEEL